MGELALELLIWIIKAITVAIILLFIGLVIEKGLHQHESMEWVATRLRQNIVAVICVLANRKRMRHNFTKTLETELTGITDPYREPAFESLVDLYIDEKTPCLDIAFVPKRGLSIADIQAVTNLLLLKFRDYLVINGLPFGSFAVYQTIQQRIHVKIHYAEFEKEVPALRKCYQKAIAKVVGMDYGCLHDTDLDAELNNVD